jgi:sodium transport system permease protein
VSARWPAVFRKELVDHVRDRRSMLFALFMALLYPGVTYWMFSHLATREHNSGPTKLLVVGAENAPNLVAFLEQAGLKIVPAPANYQARIASGDAAVALFIPKEYGAAFQRGQPATVRLVSDSSNDKTGGDVARVGQLLEAYGSQIGALRLIARGVNPKVAAPLTVEGVDVATRRKRSGQALTVIPLFMIMSVFLSMAFAATDALAGERERSSLEPLLLTSAGRLDLVVGKWLALVSLAGAALVVTAGAFTLAIPRIPFEDLGMQARFGPVELSGMLLLFAPLVFLSTGLQLLVSTFARSFREAQSYLSLLMLGAIAPGLVLSIEPVKPARWLAAVPLFGQQILANELIRGELAQPLRLLLPLPATLIVAALCTALTVRLLREERIIFGR